MKIKNIIIIVLLVSFASGCATTRVERAGRHAPKQFTRLPKFDVPITINDRVVAWLDYFSGPGRKHFERYLARSGKYQPLMEDILKKYALPQDLVYVAMIESGFNAKAYSRARASGFWQFIMGTGRRYGLAMNGFVDERRDPEKSTAAAARYLRDLFGKFGDWHLAMAAYNAGEGKIAKAIHRNGTRDFWQMIERDRRFLKAETKDYVPKFIAAAIISKSPERFGFGDVVYEQPLEFEKVKIDSQADIDVIAKCAEVGADIVSELNPELTRGITPNANYEIRLPKGVSEKFESAFAKIPVNERVMVARHTVSRGETAGKIAKRYGITVRALLAANDLSNISHVKRGMNLIIPIGGAARKSADAIAMAESGARKGSLTKHRVSRGETLGLIAQNYGVGVSNIKRWNRLKRDMIHPGQMLKVYGGSVEEDIAVKHRTVKGSGSQKTILVKRGDSWWRIARRHGVSINELKEWNQSKAARDLKAGEKLQLYAVKQPAEETPKTAIMTPENISSPAKNSAVLDTSDLLAFQQTPSGASNPLSYTIKSGDTLWDIARKYGISVKEIMTWNDLSARSPKRLKPGDIITLKISAN